MTAISKLQFSPFRANFCRGRAKPLICWMQNLYQKLNHQFKRWINRLKVNVKAKNYIQLKLVLKDQKCKIEIHG